MRTAIAVCLTVSALLWLPGCAGLFAPAETRIPEANSVKFTPDGSRLLSGFLITVIKETDEGEEIFTRPLINVHDPQTGIPLNQIRRGDGVWDIDVSPNGLHVASADQDRKVRIYDIPTRALVHTLDGHNDGAYCVAYSPDGGLLASGAVDGRVRLWNPRTGQLIRTLNAHTDLVYGVEFSPDGTKLVSSGAGDGTVRFWDVLNGNPIRTLDTGKSYVTDVDFSPNGKLLAVGGGRSILLIDCTSGVQEEELTGHVGQVNAVSFSPDGGSLASGAGQGDWDIRIWDVETHALVRELIGHRAQVLSLAWSPDGARLASGSSDGTVRLWNPVTGAEMWQYR